MTPNGLPPFYGNNPNFPISTNNPLQPPTPTSTPQQVFTQTIDQETHKRTNDGELENERALKKPKTNSDQSQLISNLASSRFVPSEQMTAPLQHQEVLLTPLEYLQQSIERIVTDYNKFSKNLDPQLDSQIVNFVNMAIEHEAWELIQDLFSKITIKDFGSFNDDQNFLLSKIFSSKELFFKNCLFFANSKRYLRHIDSTYDSIDLKKNSENYRELIEFIIEVSETYLKHETFLLISGFLTKTGLYDVLFNFYINKRTDQGEAFTPILEKYFIQFKYHILNLDALKKILELCPGNHSLTKSIIEICIEDYESGDDRYLDCFNYLILCAIKRKDIEYVKKFGGSLICALNDLNVEFAKKILDFLPRPDLNNFINECGSDLLKLVCTNFYEGRQEKLEDKMAIRDLMNFLNFARAPHEESNFSSKEWEIILDYEERRGGRCAKVFTALQQQKSHVAMTRAYESVFSAMSAHSGNPFVYFPQEIRDIIAVEVLQSTDQLAKIPVDRLLNELKIWEENTKRIKLDR